MIKLCEDAFLMCHGLLRRIDEMRSSPGQLTQDDRSMPFRRKERQRRRVLLEKLRDTGKRIKDDGTKVNLERDSKGNPVLFFAGGFFWGIALPALLIPLWYLIVSCGLNSTDERCKRELAAFVTLRGVLLMFGQSLLWGPTVYVAAHHGALGAHLFPKRRSYGSESGARHPRHGVAVARLRRRPHDVHGAVVVRTGEHDVGQTVDDVSFRRVRHARAAHVGVGG